MSGIYVWFWWKLRWLGASLKFSQIKINSKIQILQTIVFLSRWRPPSLRIHRSIRLYSLSIFQVRIYLYLNFHRIQIPKLDRLFVNFKIIIVFGFRCFLGFFFYPHRFGGWPDFPIIRGFWTIITSKWKVNYRWSRRVWRTLATPIPCLKINPWLIRRRRRCQKVRAWLRTMILKLGPSLVVGFASNATARKVGYPFVTSDTSCFRLF